MDLTVIVVAVITTGGVVLAATLPVLLSLRRQNSAQHLAASVERAAQEDRLSHRLDDIQGHVQGLGVAQLAATERVMDLQTRLVSALEEAAHNHGRLSARLDNISNRLQAVESQ
jgi:hypothetical protein